jgi:hypothetical protein
MRTWKVKYQCVETRQTHRPFYKQQAHVAAESRKEAIAKVKAVFSPPRYDRFTASPADGQSPCPFFS